MKPYLKLIAILLACAASASAAAPEPVWLDSVRVDNTILLLRQLPYQVMQYDLETESWLDPVELPLEPTAFTADETYLYVAFNRQVRRIRRSDGVSNHIANSADTINWVQLVGDYILFADNSQYYNDDYIYIHKKDTLTKLGEARSSYALRGLSVNPVRAEFYGRSIGVSPSDIHRLEVIEEGTQISRRDSPYHGDYGSASETWCFADGNRVIDNSGTVYNTADLTYNGSVGVAFNCMDFLDDGSCVIVRDTEISSYDRWLRKNGVLELEQSWNEIHILGETIFGFRNDETADNGIGVDKVSVGDLEIEPTAEILDPTTVDFEIDDIAVDSSGRIYLLSKNLYNIFVWSAETREWETSIPLRSTADVIEYAPAINSLYVYGGREMSLIDLNEAEPAETSFANLAWNINKIIPMGEEVLVTQNGSWDNQAILDSTGVVLNSNFQCCYDSFYDYHPATERLYMDVDGIGYFPYLGDGVLGQFESGGYFSRYDYDGIAGISPTANLIILKDGNILSGETFTKLSLLSSNIKTAMWIGSELITIENTDTGGYYGNVSTTTTVQSWNPYYVLDQTQPLAGIYQHSYIYGSDIVVLVKVGERYRFYILDEELQLIYTQPVFELENNGLSLLSVGDTTATLQWDLSDSGETEFNLQFYVDGEWTDLARVEASSNEYLVEGLFSGRHYDFRLASLARTEYNEVDAIIDTTLYLQGSFEYPDGVEMGDLYLQKFDGAEWQDLRSVNSSYLDLMPEEFLEEDSLSDFRLAFEDYITAALSAPAESDFLLHFNWLRTDAGNNGFRLLQWNPDDELWDQLAEVDNATFSHSIPYDPSVNDDFYRLEVFDGTDWNYEYGLQLSLEGTLDWTAEPDATIGWRIESRYFGDDRWYRIGDVASEQDTFDVRWVNVRNAQYEFQVLRIEDSLGVTVVDPVQWYMSCNIHWTRTTSGTRPILQYMDEAAGEWIDLREFYEHYTSGSYSYHVQEPDSYPEFRLVEGIEIPEQALGYVQFVTTVSLESTVLTGLNASDKSFHDRIVLDWNPQLSATAYEVFRGESSDPQAATQIATVQQADTPGFVDRALPEDSLYYYWVRSTDGVLYGMLSRWEDGSTAPYDEDGDGVPLPLENYLGQNATGHDVFGRVVTLGYDSGKWILYFPRSKSSDRHAFKIQWSTDLLTWRSDGLEFAEPVDQGNTFLEEVLIDAASSEPIYVRFLENVEQ